MVVITWSYVCLFSYLDHLGIDDLNVVLNSIWDARTQWFNIGLCLGVSPSDLSVINSAKSNPEECLREMLIIWLRSKHLNPTLQKLTETLRSPVVQRGFLAEMLPPTAQQLRQRKDQLALSTSPKSEHPCLPEPLPSSTPTLTTTLKPPSSQPQSFLQGIINFSPKCSVLLFI